MKQGFVGFRFDNLDMGQAVALLADRSAGSAFGYVVTPNVDHAVRLADAETEAETKSAYAAAMLCLCDSRVLAKLARIRGLKLNVVPGSDLTAKLLLGTLGPGDRIAILGSNPAAVEVLRAKLRGVEILHLEPPMGLAQNAAALEEAVAFVIDSRARYTLLAVGSPQQEVIAHRALLSGRAHGTGLCIGASIDFLTDQRRRAPVLMQRLSLEWLHRLICEPRRLWRRYLLRGPKIFLLIFDRNGSNGHAKSTKRVPD
jgi:N-acetylglucosaminyldiphosphoundecaprenol N-acetyl-beta-D-mannosaminyltransferase